MTLINSQNVFFYLWPVYFPYYAVWTKINGMVLNVENLYYVSIMF